MFFDNWRKITKDEVILDCIKGVKLDFLNTPLQINVPREYKVAMSDKLKMIEVIEEFINKGIIQEVSPVEGQIISNIFCRNKKNGKVRIIGNFIEINEQLKYIKFKQDTVQTMLNLIRKDCFMCSIDLKDAYYSIRIHEDYQKYLRFRFLGKLYSYTCLPQGLGCSPRLFTKIMKCPISKLREQNIIISAYIDDLFITADSLEECINSRDVTLKLLQELGYIINWEKSALQPSQQLYHLGLLVNSVDMTVKIGEEKCDKIIDLCQKVLSKNKCKIRDIAKLLGTMTSYIPGVELGQLHYRALESIKNSALRQLGFNFEAFCKLNLSAQEDVKWWLDNVRSECTKLIRDEPSIIICTDSSKLGWGAVTENSRTRGSWSLEDQKLHINVLEMKAVLFGLQSLCDNIKSSHIKIKTDSYTGVCYINSKGGSKSVGCNSMAMEIWKWAILRNNFISAVHLPGKLNYLADCESRKQDNNTEWTLEEKTYKMIINLFTVPTIDLFASYLNHKVDRYVSWLPDPKAVATNTFHNNFSNEIFYAFPPFSILTKFLQKVEMEKMEGILIAPEWSTQPFFPMIHRLLIQIPVRMRWKKDLLSHPNKNLIHPLGKKIKLTAFHLSTNYIKRKAFQKELWKLSCKGGESQLLNNIKFTLINGKIIVNNSVSIPFIVI